MTRKQLRMVLRLQHQLGTRFRTSGATLQEEDSHRQHTERAERRTFLSHDVSEALGERKKEEEVEGDRELNCNTCWYCDDTCFYTSEKHAIRNTQVHFHNLLLQHQAATHEEEADFRPRQHGQQGSVAGNTGSSRQFDGNCTSTLKQVVHRLIK